MIGTEIPTASSLSSPDIFHCHFNTHYLQQAFQSA